MDLLTKVSQTIAKSGKTTTDSLTELFKKVLLKEELTSIKEDKLKVLQDLIEFLSIRESQVIAVNKEENKTVLVLRRIEKPNPNNIFENLMPEEEIYFDITNQEIEGLITNNLTIKECLETEYTIEIDLFQDLKIEKEIIKTETYQYKLKLTESKDEDILNIITNKGLMSKITETVAVNEENVFIPVSRTHALNIITAKALSELYKNNNRKLNCNVIIKATDKTIKDFISKINIEKLNEKKIFLKHVETQAELDKEMIKASKDNCQTVLIASAKSVSRGVDLSFFDKMIIAGDLDRNGREFTQLVARLYNNDPNCINKQIFLYGTPAKFLFGDTPKTVPSDYMSGMIKLKNVYLFNKEILSGSTKMISDDSGTIKML
jgi:hypothetical protein